MTTRNGVIAVTASKKRPADDGFDPENGEISLKPTPPYDAKKEQTPFSVFQSKEYATYKSHEETVKQLLKAPLANLENVDRSLQGLINTINKRIDGRDPQKIVLCLTGPMGTGKSATLNSLLGIQIAREGDYGGSCTLTSCKYQAAKRDQEAAYLAEVTFFSHADRREILAAYLAAYYQATHYASEEDEEAQDKHESPEEAEVNLDIRNEVITAVFSLFGNQRECRTKQAVRDFLDGAESPRDEDILRLLYLWCDNLITKATEGKTVVAISASTAGELSQKLENFTAYAEDDSGNLAVSLTPMVALINFFFDNPLTRLGVTFLDTPGTSDYNRARKKSAETYRKLRTHCAILSDESRVKDDSGISKEVRSLRNRGAGRTVIVITRSDIIKDTTMPGGSKKDKEYGARMKKAVERIKNSLNATEIEECDAVEKDDVQRIATLTVQKRQLEIRVKLAENAEKAHRIRMRSEGNKKALEEKLEDINATAPIFSISNTEYAKHVEGYPAKNTPVLTVEQTNIPTLRRLISAFPNEARLNEIQHQQEKNLPALLSRIKLYTEKSPSDRKENMEIHVSHPMKRYATELDEDFNNLEEQLANLSNAIAAQEAGWTKTAGQLCDKWAREFKVPAFLGILKRDGRRKGNCRIREVNLSAELAEICAADIDELFRKLGFQLRQYEREMVDHMEGLVSQMIQNMQDDSNEPFMSLGAFYEYVYKEKAQLRGLVKTAHDRIVEGLDEIRQKLTWEEEDAYLVELMLPIFDQVRQLKGGKDAPGPRPKIGWPAHRRVTFKNEVTKLNGLWAKLHYQVASDLNSLMKTERERLVETIGDVFKDFYTGFDAMCKIDETANPETARIHEELNVNRAKAEEILNGPMNQAYEALERGFRGIGANSD